MWRVWFLTAAFVAAIGPLLVGPLSEVYGRNIIYRMSYVLFFICSWPVAFAPHIGEPGTPS